MAARVRIRSAHQDGTRCTHRVGPAGEPRDPECTAPVVLSGYDSPLYADLYDGCHRYTATTWTGNARTDMARTEVIWSNRPLAGQHELDLFPAA